MASCSVCITSDLTTYYACSMRLSTLEVQRDSVMATYDAYKQVDLLYNLCQDDFYKVR
jgi:hypothetical protein